MNESDSLARAIAEEISLVPYDPQWAAQFAAERNRLLALLPNRFAAIEHIGSTAVAGLSAKPIIDSMAGVPSMGDADTLLQLLCAHGYETSAEFNATLEGERRLMRHALGRRTHHLHLVVFGGSRWAQRLQFRDRLRADPAAAARYQSLKQDLAIRYRQDREAYTQAKTVFIGEILKQPAA